jgi:hypothetical protein
MTVLEITDFEAEALDLEEIPDQDEIYPDQQGHVIGPLEAELRLVGTQRKYKVCLWWDWDGLYDGIGINIWTLTDAANAGLAEHAEDRRLLKVILGAVQFTARLTVSRHSDVPTISDLFRHEPFSWGLRGDPQLWKDMQDYFDDWLLPDTFEELDQRVARAFRILTGEPIGSQENIFLEKYDMGGISSGYVSPEFWRTAGLEHLREQLAYEKDWKRPDCPSCESNEIARIIYGYREPELFEDKDRGDVVLGGCCVTENDPEWHCRACEHEW